MYVVASQRQDKDDVELMSSVTAFMGQASQLDALLPLLT
jgi:hypothetical protein